MERVGKEGPESGGAYRRAWNQPRLQPGDNVQPHDDHLPVTIFKESPASTCQAHSKQRTPSTDPTNHCPLTLPPYLPRAPDPESGSPRHEEATPMDPRRLRPSNPSKSLQNRGHTSPNKSSKRSQEQHTKRMRLVRKFPEPLEMNYNEHPEPIPTA